jgi:3-methylcrotonyl-CoA carboxylase alpha subunit
MLARAQGEIEAMRLRNGGETWNPWRTSDGFQLGGERRQMLAIVVDGTPTEREVRWTAVGPTVRAPGGTANHIRIVEAGDTVFVQQDLVQTELRRPSHDAEKEEDVGREGAVIAPINGRIASVLVAEGERIEKGARIAVIEAMKVEHVLVAPRAGPVSKLAVKEGEQVTRGALVAALGGED